MVFVRYLGHSCFEFITKNRHDIVIDPYQNQEEKEWFLKEFPNIQADFVVVTHDHFDHNASHKVLGNPNVLDKVGKEENEDFTIEMFEGKHAHAFDYMFYENRIVLLESEGLRFCHWGDNEANVSSALLKKLGRVDVLMLPVDDSEHLLKFDEVQKVIGQVNPRIIVPMHYFNKDLTSKESTLKPINRWLKGFKMVREIPSEGVQFGGQTLTQDQEIWVFERFHPFDAFKTQ